MLFLQDLHHIYLPSIKLPEAFWQGRWHWINAASSQPAQCLPAERLPDLVFPFQCFGQTHPEHTPTGNKAVGCF